MARERQKTRAVKILFHTGVLHIVCLMVGGAGKIAFTRRVSPKPSIETDLGLPFNGPLTSIDTLEQTGSTNSTEKPLESSNQTLVSDDNSVPATRSTYSDIEMIENITNFTWPVTKKGYFSSLAKNMNQISDDNANTTSTILVNGTLYTFQEFIGIENQAGSILRGVASSCLEVHDTRICSCDAGCRLQNNCCYDSDYVDPDSSSLEGVSSFSCFTELNSIWWLGSPATLVGQCPQAWPNDEIRQTCSNPSPEKTYENIPCHSNSTGINYKNVYCHRCNGESMLTPWRVGFECGLPRIYEDVDSMEEMLKLAEKSVGPRGCRFVLSPPDHIESPHCVQIDIAQCKHNNTDDLLRRSCLAYYNPVISRDGNIYRNINCLKCNSGIYVDKFVKIGRRPHGAMSVLLNINPLVTGNPEMDENLSNCGTGQVFNMGECEPIAKQVRGYCGYFIINATVNNLTDEAPTQFSPSVQIEFNRRTAAYLKQQFRSFSPTVRSIFLGMHSTELSYGITLIFNTGHVVIDNLGDIRRTVESMQFTFDYQNSLRVACCNERLNQSTRNVPASAVNQPGLRAVSDGSGQTTAEMTSSNPPRCIHACIICIVLPLIFHTSYEY